MKVRNMTRGRRLFAAAASVVLVAATVGAGSASVGADDGPGIPDVPSLGFSIDPSQGPVGSTVNGQVDVDDIAQHCITDPMEFAEQFLGPGGLATTDPPPYSIHLTEINTQLNSDPDADPALVYAGMIAAFVPLGLFLDADSDDPDAGGLVQGAIEQTMIMGFADLATQRPIAPYGNFDPSTGEGSTPVPDVDGGSQVVIATCVGLPESLSENDLWAALEVTAEYIRENIAEPYPMDPFSDEFAEVGGEVFPVLLQELVEPKALGIAAFCVDDGAGSCDEAPPTTDPDGEKPGDDKPGDETPGGGAGNGTDDGSGHRSASSGNGSGSAPAATPVSGSPTYTG